MHDVDGGGAEDENKKKDNGGDEVREERVGLLGFGGEVGGGGFHGEFWSGERGEKVFVEISKNKS